MDYPGRGCPAHGNRPGPMMVGLPERSLIEGTHIAPSANSVSPLFSGRGWHRRREVENEDFHDATSIAGMPLAGRPGNARNAVATAAIAANRQADRNT